MMFENLCFYLYGIEFIFSIRWL